MWQCYAMLVSHGKKKQSCAPLRAFTVHPARPNGTNCRHSWLVKWEPTTSGKVHIQISCIGKAISGTLAKGNLAQQQQCLAGKMDIVLKSALVMADHVTFGELGKEQTRPARQCTFEGTEAGIAFQWSNTCNSAVTAPFQKTLAASYSLQTHAQLQLSFDLGVL